MELHLHNSMTRRKELFVPLEAGRVKMYHCGPTVYDHAHIGNFRSFLLGDVLRRVLERAGYEVIQVLNITDVGHLTEDDVDRISVGTQRESLDPCALTRRYTESFMQDKALLGFRQAHHHPRATEHIPQMIAMIEQLLASGHAYQTSESVYYDISRFPQYGELSGNSLEDLQAGARVAVRNEKRHPLDFALWKRDPQHLMTWDSPWGEGFPGWHIECSAMSLQYLGPTFDIHTGGEDNLFPHHECEIAQSVAGNGVPFVRYWLHSRHLLVDGGKMSKSKGNYYTVGQLAAEGYEGREIRHALLAAHYRQALNFTREGLDRSRATLNHLTGFLRRLRGPAEGEPRPELDALIATAETDFDHALADDLNLPRAQAALFELVAAVNRLGIGPGDGIRVEGILRSFDAILGIMPPADTLDDQLPPDIQLLVDRRQAARKYQDYTTADSLRGELSRLGYSIEDGPHGPLVIRKHTDSESPPKDA